MIPYKDVPRENIILPPLEKDKAYVRPPMSEQTFVPNKF
jgi:polyphosphate kinase